MTARGIGWKSAWTIARRDLSTGFGGLRLLFLCLFLGTATLAAIGSLTAAITGEISARGREILGGDLEVAMTQREIDPAERAELASAGTLSETVRTRAMARPIGPKPGTPDAVLTELKGVDRAYPLYGRLTLADGRVSPQLGPDELLVDQALADRLQIGTGDTLRYGEASFRIVGIIGSEPDRVGEGFTLGPVAITSLEGLRRTNLLLPGALFESKYRLRLAGREPGAVREALTRRFPESGWEFRDRDRAAPGASRFFERLGQFLGLIGLAALVIAGIGVSNGVGSYLTGKRNGIATLKVLGATSRDIARIYLLQLAAVSGVAILAGLIIGAIVPIAIVAAAGDLLPVEPRVQPYPLPLAVSAAFGVLVAGVFALPPLARARLLPAAALFRGGVSPSHRIDWRTLLLVLGGIVLIIALAVGTARDPLFAAGVLAAVAGVLVLLLVIGVGVRAIAKRLPRPTRPLLRLAIANLHRPGAQTGALVVALGLALTLFVTLAAIQTVLRNEIATTVPKRAPSQFVLDIPSSGQARFRQIVTEAAPGAELNMVPALRGTIVAYGGVRVADREKLPDDAWFLRGERGVTYSATLPEGSDLVSGSWWPRDYAGPPLVSLDEEAAKVMGVAVGDRLTISVLGREIEARIASLREIHWDTMGFNYIMVFSPNTLASAPHTLAATISTDPAREGAVARAVLGAFPSASIIEVGEVIAQVSTILNQMSAAILLSASIAILAGIAVLVGAIAASRQARAYDSVILKTLGATRGQILSAQAIEYLLLAGTLATVALGLGLLGAWYVTVQIFEFNWSPDWAVVLGTLGAGALLTLGIGLIGSIPLLSVRPAEALRRG